MHQGMSTRYASFSTRQSYLYSSYDTVCQLNRKSTVLLSNVKQVLFVPIQTKVTLPKEKK